MQYWPFFLHFSSQQPFLARSIWCIIWQAMLRLLFRFRSTLQTVTHISDSRKSTHIQVKLESQKSKYLLTRTITFILKLFPTLMNANIFELTQTKFIIYCRISFFIKFNNQNKKSKPYNYSPTVNNPRIRDKMWM